MSILMLMVPIALLLSGSFLAAFVWATQAGQFDDTQTPAHRMLLDEKDTAERDIAERDLEKNENQQVKEKEHHESNKA
jgi:cbb3-type cytochrome oxidase maturation protein